MHQVVQQILGFVQRKGKPFEMLAELRGPDSSLSGLASGALDDLEALFHLLQAMGCLHCVEFDLTIVGGLDYYTGIIFEAFCESLEDDPSVAIDLPVAAGGW